MAGFLRSLFSRGAKAEEPPRDEPSVEYQRLHDHADSG